MIRIMNQVAEDQKIDETKNHVVIKFPGSDRQFTFNVQRRSIIINHKSHAVIATVTGRAVLYKGNVIKANNKVFDWLGEKYTIDYVTIEKPSEGTLANGVISYM